MEDSVIDSDMDSDLDLMMMDSGVNSGADLLLTGVDSTMDSDSDLMMTILGWILGWILKMILCRILYGGSSMEDLLWRILALILQGILIRV